MKCLFCKCDSSASKSVEHIIPESLGNRDHVLPPGIVCDRCNNYFARSVEKRFLECEAIKLMRFEQALPSKRGRVPPIYGVSALSPAFVKRAPHPDSSLEIEFSPKAIKRINESGKGTLILPAAHDNLPQGTIVSRFLAKVALEALASKLLHVDGALEALIQDSQTEPIREHARFGAKIQNWPTHIRRIYPPEGFEGSYEQVVHEFDILITDQREWYFVLAIFGLELVINYAGPSISGYKHWLKEHEGTSPLYYGKNTVERRS